MISIIDRVAAVAATRAAFARRSFEPGQVDCAAMVAFHLGQLGIAAPAVPHYRTLRGGLLALRRLGFANLEALMDSILPRIAPAHALSGDVFVMQPARTMPGEDGLAALVIKMDRKVIGFHEDAEGLAAMTPWQIEAAWSVG